MVSLFEGVQDDGQILLSPDTRNSQEWYTPSSIIEAARLVMGGIDLDPASCEQANRTVKATRYYTREENGLSLPWNGRTWCNPPYGRTNGKRAGGQSLQGLFTEKLIVEWQMGRVEQAILLLLGNSCFAQYFSPLWSFRQCFYTGHIIFERENGTPGEFGFGTILVYLGPNKEQFSEAFQRFGTIIERVSRPDHRSARTLPLL